MALLGPQTLPPLAATRLSAAPACKICSLKALDKEGMLTATGIGPEWMQLTSCRPPLVIWYVKPCAALLVPTSLRLVQTTAPLPSLTTSCPSFCIA
jgi:hypothetical protein